MLKKLVLKILSIFVKGVYLRTLGNPMKHGFFTSHAKLKEALENDIDEGEPVYFLGHKLADPSKYPQNRFEVMKKGSGVKADDVEKLRYLILDIDPLNGNEEVAGERVKRNLTPQEHALVLKDARAIRDHLIGEGITNIGLIDSGNGAYLYFPFKGIDADKDHIALLKRFAHTIARKVMLEHSAIDFSTIKSTQVFKCPGTLSIKGLATENNPYRHAKILEAWDQSVSTYSAIKKYSDEHDLNSLFSNSSNGAYLDTDKCIDRGLKIYQVCNCGNNDFYARALRKNKFYDLKLTSTEFGREVRIYLTGETGLKTIDPDIIREMITSLSDKAYQQDVVTPHNRAFFDQENNVVYYDLVNNKDVVKITPDSIEIVDKPFGNLFQATGDLEQVPYKDTPAQELPKLLHKFIKISDKDLIILAAHLCVCIIANFPTCALLITGPKGSSKSCTTRYIQRIIHPSKGGLLSLISEKKQDLAIALSRRLLTCFDNAAAIKPEISDLLCSVITKGCYTTRELYTTDSEKLIEYKSNIVINSIDVVSHRTDLMSRCIMIEMEKISPEERKTEIELNRMFEDCLPQILGAIFDTIRCSLSIKDTDVAVSSKSRMADYELWATKCAISMGFTEQEYKDALESNIHNLTDAVSFGNPTIFAVCELMRGKSVYNDGVQATYNKCNDILDERMTTQEKQLFPKSSSAFSRSLGGMDENFKAFGISYNIVNVGPNKEITIYNDGSLIPNVNPNDEKGKLTYSNQATDSTVSSSNETEG